MLIPTKPTRLEEGISKNNKDEVWRGRECMNKLKQNRRKIKNDRIKQIKNKEGNNTKNQKIYPSVNCWLQVQKTKIKLKLAQKSNIIRKKTTKTH